MKPACCAASKARPSGASCTALQGSCCAACSVIADVPHGRLHTRQVCVKPSTQLPHSAPCVWLVQHRTSQAVLAEGNPAAWPAASCLSPLRRGHRRWRRPCRARLHRTAPPAPPAACRRWSRTRRRSNGSRPGAGTRSCRAAAGTAAPLHRQHPPGSTIMAWCRRSCQTGWSGMHACNGFRAGLRHTTTDHELQCYRERRSCNCSCMGAAYGAERPQNRHGLTRWVWRRWLICKHGAQVTGGLQKVIVLVGSVCPTPQPAQNTEDSGQAPYSEAPL